MSTLSSKIGLPFGEIAINWFAISFFHFNTTNFFIVTAIVIYLLLILPISFRFSKKPAIQKTFMWAATSSVSQNVVQDFLHVKLTEKQSLFVTHITIAVIAILGITLARDPDSSVFGIVSFAWAGFGGASGAVMLCALFPTA